MRRLQVVTVNVSVLLLLLEFGSVFVLRAPSTLRFMPRGLVEYFRSLYLDHDRRIIQFDADFAQFDELLSYRLRPGRFVFENREFRNEFRVNSAGLRDDEASLEGPEIIVLGDSYAMGWGVDQEDTFAQRIEQHTGAKVLNAGISSYATAREMKLLNLLDTTRLKFLIVQYSDGDADENRKFEDGDQRRIVDEEAFQRVVRYHEGELRYYPGKYAFHMIARVATLVGELLQEPARAESEDAIVEEVDLFLYSLWKRTEVHLAGMRVLVVALGGWGSSPDRFISVLDERKTAAAYPPYIRELVAIDLVGQLGPEYAYQLDDHLRSEGHAVVAQAILRELEPSQRPAEAAASPWP